jgi:hypothetical protein
LRKVKKRAVIILGFMDLRGIGEFLAVILGDAIPFFSYPHIGVVSGNRRNFRDHNFNLMSGTF